MMFGKLYFLYPGWVERGDVYRIPSWAKLPFFKVVMPDGVVVKPDFNPRSWPHFDTSWVLHGNSRRIPIKARLLFNWGGSAEYKGDWTPLIELLNAAAEVNLTFCVALTHEECKLLADGKLNWLKEHLTPDAVSLLRLSPEGSCVNFGVDGPVLDLLRTGRCP